MTHAYVQMATQALNKWDWTIGHFKQIQTQKNSILFPTQILNKQVKSQNLLIPCNTRYFPFISKQRKMKSEGECLYLHCINHF